MYLITLILLFCVKLVTSDTYIHDQYEYYNSQFHGRKPFFENLYTARTIDNDVEIVEGPIILQNCGVYIFGIRISTGNVTFSTGLGPTEYFGIERNCSVLASFSITELDKTYINTHLHSVFKIQAFYDHYVVAESNIVAFNTPKKLIYDINGKKYLILSNSWNIIFVIYVSLSATISVVLIFVTIIRNINNAHKYSSVSTAS